MDQIIDESSRSINTVEQPLSPVAYPNITWYHESPGASKKTASKKSRPHLPSTSQSDSKVPKQRRTSSTSSIRTSSPTPKGPGKGKQRATSNPQLSSPLSVEERYQNEEHDNVSADDTHREINTYLNRPLTTKRKEKLAQVYIFQDPDRKSIIKIGLSQTAPERVAKQVKDCKLKSLLPVYISRLIKVAHAAKVEKLAHIELRHFRRRFSCGGCQERHQEFFEVEHDVAKNVIERWIAFLGLGVYGKDNNFLETWKNKIVAFIDKNRPIQDHNDHDGRNDWWERMTEEYFNDSEDEVEAEETEAKTTSSPPTIVHDPRKMVRQEWAIWCIIQAAWLYLSASNWVFRNLLYLPHLIGLTIFWILLDLQAFGVLQHSIPDLRCWSANSSLEKLARLKKTASSSKPRRYRDRQNDSRII